jgi:ribosomal protein L24
MGDTVRVIRGDRRGFEGRITRVDRKNFRIYVEGVTRDKVDGTTIQIPIHPSKAMIVNLNLDDKWRREALKRKTPLLPKRFRNETTTKTGPEAVEEAGKEPAAKKPRRRSKGTREATVSSQKTRRKVTKTTKKDESRKKKAKTARTKKEAE